MRKCAPHAYQAWSPSPRLEGEGHDCRDAGVRAAPGAAAEEGGVDKQRFSEAARVTDFRLPI